MRSACTPIVCLNCGRNRLCVAHIHIATSSLFMKLTMVKWLFEEKCKHNGENYEEEEEE